MNKIKRKIKANIKQYKVRKRKEEKKSKRKLKVQDRKKFP